MSENGTTSGGIWFFGLLGVLFIGLKVTNYIDWSWWWVLAPILIGPLVFVFVLALLAAGALLIAAFE